MIKGGKDQTNYQIKLHVEQKETRSLIIFESNPLPRAIK